jgi:hypothetical protein
MGRFAALGLGEVPKPKPRHLKEPRALPPVAWQHASIRPDADVVTVKVAGSLLGVPEILVGIRAEFGYLETCFNAAWELCVTKASVDAELQWWEEATLSDRLHRARRMFRMWRLGLAG